MLICEGRQNSIQLISHALFVHIKTIEPICQPATIMMDFECASSIAICRSQFLDTRTVDCWFHFSQRLWQKILELDLFADLLPITDSNRPSNYVLEKSNTNLMSNINTPKQLHGSMAIYRNASIYLSGIINDSG